MKVKIKILIIFAFLIISSLILIIVQYTNKNKIVNLFTKSLIEEKKVVFNTLINYKSNELKNHVFDYSNWDDLINNVENKDLNWLNDNINQETFDIFDLSSIYIYDKNGILFFEKNIKLDYINKIPVNNPTDFDLFLNNINYLKFYDISKNNKIIELHYKKIISGQHIVGYYFATKEWSNNFINEIESKSESKIYTRLKKDTSKIEIPTDLHFINNISLNNYKKKKIADLLIYKNFNSLNKILYFIDLLSYGIIIYLIIFSLIIIFIQAYWFFIPLNRISKSLKNQSHKYLKKYNTNNDEFGSLSRTIENFLQQQILLIEKNQELSIQKEKLQELNHELEISKTQLHEMNQTITESISYAKLIQNALLSVSSNIKLKFEIGIVFMPKDKISGDFYWFHEDTEYQKSYIALVDCTGHGVPGGFMSLISNRLLDTVMLKYKNPNPADVLKHLNNEVIRVLHQSVTENDDGMDMALISIEKLKSNWKIVFSGARQSLAYIHINDHEVSVIKGVRKSVGGAIDIKNKKEYLNHELILNSNTILTLHSDGISDLGNNKGKRYGSKKLYNLIKEYKNESLRELKRHIIKDIHIYKEDQDLRDDICILSLRLNDKKTIP